jgi:hypothetical protein
MNNLKNEKSGMALAAENEIESAINSQKEGVTVIDPEKNIIVLNRNKSNHNGFFLGTSGEGRMFHSKYYFQDFFSFKDIYDNNGFFSEEKIVQKVKKLYKENFPNEKNNPLINTADKLILSIILLLFEESEYKAKRTSDGKIIPETRDFSILDFFSVKRKLNKIFFSADPKDTNFKNDLDLDFEELYKKKPNTLARQYYNDFCINPVNTKNLIISTIVNTRMYYRNCWEEY